MPLILDVIPGTGHHYFTFRLAELFPKKSNDDLVKLVKKDPPRFVPWSLSDPWLRYRLFTDEQGTPLITIAVESNLGHRYNSTLYKSNPCVPNVEPEIESEYFPYAREFLKDPMRGQKETIKTSISVGGSPQDVEIQVNFRPRTGPPVDVDLIIDLGNTRTAAILLEIPDDVSSPPLGNRVRVLKIGPRGREIPQQGGPQGNSGAGDQNDLAIIDSWFLLHETIFARLEPGQPEGDCEYVIKDAKEIYLQKTEQKAWYYQYYMPHAFIELSPALIGGGKSLEGAPRIFSDQNLTGDYPFYLSSPKRYVWSQKRAGLDRGAGAFWHQIPNRTSSEPVAVQDLRGLIRHFMAPGGRDLNTDYESLKLGRPPANVADFGFIHNAAPTYSRSDAVCWFALSLIEAAYRQINTRDYLEKAWAHNTQRRRLRHIRVTCPSGWTYEERSLYYRQWQRAINLFTMAHLDNWELVTSLGNQEEAPAQPAWCADSLDEAVCSQLPILYAELKAFSGPADKWIELYGQDHSGSFGRESTIRLPIPGELPLAVRVMNLDIGGGTTDLAIIEYKNLAREEVLLWPNLLFRDGYQIAGDMVVKKIIEQVLIPVWLRASQPGEKPVPEEARKSLENLFRDPGNHFINRIGGQAATASKLLARIIRLVFIPLANLLLKKLCGEPGGEPGKAGRPAENYCELNVKGCTLDVVINNQALADLNSLCTSVIGFYHPNSGWEAGRDNAFSENAVLKCPLKTVEHCIDEVFEPLFTALSGLVARYKCDLLIVSGKPSELNRLYKLIRHTFPLMPQRIIRIKDYPAGNWYPSEFATVNDFKITDAKTCTVVGAALYQDIKHNHIAGFGVKLDATEQFQRNAYWGIIPKPKSNHDFFENLLFRPEQYPPEPRVSSPVECLEKESLAVTLNAAGLNRIGRQLVNDKKIKPAPVYVLVWDRKVEEAEVLEAEVRIVFRWRCFKGKGDMLEIASVFPQPGCPAITKADLRLELSTLMPDSENEDEEFWLDRPRLKVTLSNK